MSSLFSKPKLPEIAPPTPLPDEEQIGTARKRRLRREVSTQGAQSTLLSTAGAKETLGA